MGPGVLQAKETGPSIRFLGNATSLAEEPADFKTKVGQMLAALPKSLADRVTDVVHPGRKASDYDIVVTVSGRFYGKKEIEVSLSDPEAAARWIQDEA